MADQEAIPLLQSGSLQLLSQKNKVCYNMANHANFKKLRYSLPPRSLNLRSINPQYHEKTRFITALGQIRDAPRISKSAASSQRRLNLKT